VLFSRTVERRSDDLPFDRASHVRDLFWTFVNEEHDEMHFGVVRLDRVRDLLHDRRLARLWRRHDETTLALADRRDKVHDARGEVVRIVSGLKTQLRIGEQRREVFELGPALRLFGIMSRDRVNADQRGILLA